MIFIKLIKQIVFQLNLIEPCNKHGIFSAASNCNVVQSSLNYLHDVQRRLYQLHQVRCRGFETSQSNKVDSFYIRFLYGKNKIYIKTIKNFRHVSAQREVTPDM